jgi:hypothetical protein
MLRTAPKIMRDSGFFGMVRADPHCTQAELWLVAVVLCSVMHQRSACGRMHVLSTGGHHV